MELDGEWQHTIIDDKLYLRVPDYDEAFEERSVWEDINRKDPEEEYRRTHQTGSRALYFASCVEEDETWLPLLEKVSHNSLLDITDFRRLTPKHMVTILVSTVASLAKPLRT